MAYDESCRPKVVGELDAGKPHVQFDEGVQETGGLPHRACALLYEAPISDGILEGTR